LACFTGYKYRRQILKWLNDKPAVSTKNYIIKDLDVLRRYKVSDAIDRIVAEEESWENDKVTLEKRLQDMKDQVNNKKTGAGVIQPEEVPNKH
jgi:hypothetical protein